jgi:hypothetical protein
VRRAGRKLPRQTHQSIVLSEEVTLSYVLDQSGCEGHLNVGRVARAGKGQLRVYDSYGELFEYISEARLRSWCVLGPDGQPLDGWRQIHPTDTQGFASVIESRGMKR